MTLYGALLKEPVKFTVGQKQSVEVSQNDKRQTSVVFKIGLAA